MILANAAGLDNSERALVLGASGWFGRTAMELFESIGVNALAIRTCQSTGSFSAPESLTDKIPKEVLDFEPTFILDFAFLTKNKLTTVETGVFRKVNEDLTNRLLMIAQLPSVKKVLYVSSGAAVQPFDAIDFGFEANPYGYMKRAAEIRLQNLVEANYGQKSVSILRAWSVTGKYVRHPSEYLFSSLVEQAISGEITIQSPKLVFRRYVSVADSLAVAMSNFKESRFSILETGGELIEARDLAEKIRRAVNPRAKIYSTSPISGERDDYYSDNSSWLCAITRMNLSPATLLEQIEDYANYYISGL